MDDLDRNLFGSYLVSVGEVYSKEISPMLIEIYWRIMRSFPLGAVKSAFNKHVTEPGSGVFFPKPADLVKIINATGEVRVMANDTCDRCNRPAMLINNAKSPLNGKSLCFDHYMFMKETNATLENPIKCLERQGEDVRTAKQKKYDQMRADSRQEAYIQLKKNFYASNG